MSEIEPVYVPADGGDAVFLVGDTYTTLLRGEQTGGTFTLLEAIVPADTGPPPHFHEDADETFFLLDGAVTFHVGHDVHEATTGATVFVQRGTPHHFRNTGDTARMLFTYSPAAMVDMFAEIGRPGVRGQVGPPLDMADVDAMVAVAAKYRFTVLPPA